MLEQRRLYHRLVVAAQRLRKEADQRCLAAAGITAAQAGAMFAIAADPGCPQRRLAATLGLAESATNGLVSRLVEGGFVARARSEADQRTLQLRLTTAGRRALRQVSSGLEEFNTLIEGGLAAEDLDATSRVLDTILHRTEPSG
jgi:MarR family transcriptional regulator, organic hydroperoxide resistance regulator